MAERTLLAALVQAVERDPGSVPLRLHLATLLLESGAEGAALEHFAVVLRHSPANVQALEGAARAADSLGDSRQAEGYRQLLRGLQATSPGPPEVPDQKDSPPEPNPSELAETQPHPTPLSGEGLEATDSTKQGSDWWDIESPKLTLDDVGGMEQVKHRLSVAFLQPMRNPELRKAYAKSLRGGLLLCGPPGCGKTFIARATAGELGARFLAVGLADVLDMWFGQSEQRLHEIFQTARRNAPCVLFFDEIDALGQKRVQLRQYGSMRNVVNQLLSEMDGIGADNESVFILGATNQPWDIDSALLRPGRFDRIALVLPPDEPARAAIVKHHLRERPAAGVGIAAIAAQTDGYSGADLAYLCESATELAMEESALTGVVRSLTNDDFKRAAAQVKPSTRPWFETARNFVLFANEGGRYDDLLNYMKAKRLL